MELSERAKAAGDALAAATLLLLLSSELELVVVEEEGPSFSFSLGLVFAGEDDEDVVFSLKLEFWQGRGVRMVVVVFVLGLRSLKYH